MKMGNQKNKYTHFGSQKVLFSAKSKLVKNVFSSVSQKYDLMNDIMSLGLHRLWKKELMNFLPDTSNSLLDIAGGSGNIAYNYLLKSQKHFKNPYIAVCDINKEMLNVASSNFIDNGALNSIDLVAGDAMKLPWASHSFDYITIAFGIRNVTDIQKTLQEAYRVLKPSGKFVCMEFSHVESKFLSKIYDLYSFQIIPKLGKFITSNEEAYQYLIESIKNFPNKNDFLQMIDNAEFKSTNYKLLLQGVVAIHYGYKL